MTLDANRLRVLVEVAHAGSIAAAAQRMAFTPSALSQQLSKLELEVGCTLLHRRASGVVLTDAGRTLLEHGERIVGQLREAEQALAPLRNDRTSRLSIGTFATAGKSLLPAAMAAFRREHPDTRLSLVDLEPPNGYGLVVSRELDLLISHRYPGVVLPGLRGLIRRRLLVDPLRLVLPAGHPRAGGEAGPSFAELADDDWICGSVGLGNRTCLEYLARTARTRFRVAYETHDYEVTLALIRAGLGIALVPESVLAETTLGGLSVGSLHGANPARDVFVVHRRHSGAAVTTMLGLLQPVSRPSSG